MRNICLICFLICCLMIYYPAVPAFAQESVKISPPTSEETKICIECHTHYSPGIVEDWLKSRHSASTPEDALKKPVSERRVSAQSFPENSKSVAVGCYECHSLNADAHKDNFEHAGMLINVIVSPNDCRTCHPVEAEQYTDSKKAHALDNLRSNPLYSSLVDNIVGLKEFKDDSMTRFRASDYGKQETCYACHGTEVKVEWIKEIPTDLGNMKIPVFSNWPNQGVGRINPDSSRGSCTACHPRHSFSIEIARKPHTCSQCHLEPDAPAWDVYKESKHGNIYNSKYHEWKWSEVPWKLGKDFNAPTCSACHNSLLATSEGKTIVSRTHNFGERLWVRLFGLIYSHPQPQKGSTYIIKNPDGLPMPVTFNGVLASEYLIDAAEQSARQIKMEGICKSCHGANWVDAHFKKLNNTIGETDRMVLTATNVIEKAWKDGLADNSNPFDESIEHKWMKQWLFYANSVRYASAMTGAPDYAAFKNGWWELTQNLQDMQSIIALKSGDKEQPPEFVSTADGAKKTDETAEYGFGNLDLSGLSDSDKNYLGLKVDAKPVLRNVNADMIIFEFISVYCPSCQMQSPIFNQLYSALEADSALRDKVKMIGVGAGNNKNEVDQFRQSREVTFPILPDPNFAIYKMLADSVRTPYTLILMRDKSGNFVSVGSHTGLIRSYESFLADIKAAMQYDEDSIKLKQQEQLDATGAISRTELKLSGEELMAKVKGTMAVISGDESINIALKPIPGLKDSKVYEGTDNKGAKYFAAVVNRESVCDICHAIQFIYVFNEKGNVVGFEPIHLTKYGNKVWNETDVQKMRQRVIGRSILQPVSFEPKVDAVTSATITSAVVFEALSQGREIFQYIAK